MSKVIKLYIIRIRKYVIQYRITQLRRYMTTLANNNALKVANQRTSYIVLYLYMYQ